jgi:hypothetical protein
MINTQKEAESFFRKSAPQIYGSLCVFGDWFGKPHDNCYRIKSFEVKGKYFKLTFNEDETLEIWDWNVLNSGGNGFIIQYANRVRWEWFYYGRPKLPENRFYIEHNLKDGAIEAKSNVNWYTPSFKPSLLAPAVSIG